MEKKLISYLTLLMPYVLLLGIWGYFAVLYAVPFWQERGDYSWYSLSQAFTWESTFAGVPATNLGYSIHPGVPFGFVSWIAFNGATLGVGSATNRIAYATAHADTYWLWAKAMALMLNFAGVYALRYLLGRNTPAFWLGFAAYFAVVPAVFGLSLIQLTNESFALPFMVGYYALAWRFYRTYDAKVDHASEKSESARQRDFLTLGAGAAAAFGCSIKIYYLAPAIGIAFGMLVAVLCGTMRWRDLRRYYARGIAGFVVVGALIVFLVIGRHTFLMWAGWNWHMLTHVDRYGSGQSGIFSFRLVLSAIDDLSGSSGLRFPAILLLFALASLAALAMHRSDPDWRRRQLPYYATVSLGFLINLFALLKHYSPLSQHYALPLCATLPCLLPIVAQPARIGRRLIQASAFFAALAMMANIASYATQHQAKRKLALALINDEASIEALPLAPGQKRIWGYFSATKSGVLPMIDQYAGSALVHDRLFGTSLTDTAPTADRDAVDWQYVIFPKTYFPTRDSIARTYREQFDFAVTKFRLRPDDQITELRNFFVVTRRSPIDANSKN